MILASIATSVIKRISCGSDTIISDQTIQIDTITPPPAILATSPARVLMQFVAVSFYLYVETPEIIDSVQASAT